MRLTDISWRKLEETLPKGPTGRLVRVGLAALGALLLFQLIFIPLRSYRKDLTANLDLAKRQLDQVSALAAQYAALKASNSVAVRAATGDQKAFYAFVEALARSLGLMGNVESIRPDRHKMDDGKVQEEISIRFKSLLQPQFVDFLYAVEFKEQGVEVKSLSLRKDKERRLDADLTLILVHPE